MGPLPQTLATYHERSPLRSVQNIHDPLALFQGADDRVVPPDQSERIAQALSERGIPHLFRLYEGEGHGWRKSENCIHQFFLHIRRRTDRIIEWTNTCRRDSQTSHRHNARH